MKHGPAHHLTDDSIVLRRLATRNFALIRKIILRREKLSQAEKSHLRTAKRLNRKKMFSVTELLVYRFFFFKQEMKIFQEL